MVRIPAAVEYHRRDAGSVRALGNELPDGIRPSNLSGTAFDGSNGGFGDFGLTRRAERAARRIINDLRGYGARAPEHRQPRTRGSARETRANTPVATNPPKTSASVGVFDFHMISR